MATTIWTAPTLTLDNTGDEGFTKRQICYLLTGNAQDQVRVTFRASTSNGNFTTAHCSIGIASGAGGNTTATPVELLFSAASGFNISQNTQIVSDWANLTGFTVTDHLVVVMDIAGTGGAIRYEPGIVALDSIIYHAASASYNSATAPGGSTTTSNEVQGVLLIETQAVATTKPRVLALMGVG